MPYTLKTQQISVKDPDSGEYIGVDVLAEQTKEGLIAELQAEGDIQIERINQAAVDVQSAVDQAETEAQQLISSTQSSLNTLESQKDTIAQTIASMAELGTDTTLTTAGMAADAQKTGDEISNIKITIEEAKSHGISDTAIFLLDAIGNNIAYTSQEGGGLWNSLIAELQNPTETERYYITYSGEHFISSNKMAYAVEGRGYSTTISPKAGYIISSLTATMDGVSITPIDNEDGTFTVNIPSANGAITISVAATIDPATLIYHVENLVCDGTQEIIETPLEFSSPTANGVAGDWTVCVRATQDARYDYRTVIGTKNTSTRLAYASYAHTGGTNYPTRLRCLGSREAMVETMMNNVAGVVFTHKAGNNTTITAYYIPFNESSPVTAILTSQNGINNLDYNNNLTPLCVGRTTDNGSDAFVGTIKDVTIYNFEMSQEDAYAYILEE